MKIVTIGGGTGQYHVLRALMEMKRECDVEITAIPTTLDSGGSSGILRFACQIPAPGDISQCVFGLHPDPENASWLFSHRFNRVNGGDSGLAGHTVRNIIVATALQAFGRNQIAIDAVRDLFALKGTIAPISFSPSHLHARLADGTRLSSEQEIYEADIVAAGGVERLWLEPAAEPNTAALEAIAAADTIIVCPGTLICSIIPNFLVSGVREALRAAAAQKIYVANLMNRHGHVSPSWSVLDHVEYLERYLEEGFFRTIISNTQELSALQLRIYRNEKMPVAPEPNSHDWERLHIRMPLLMETDELASERTAGGDELEHLRASVRHDPHKLALAITVALNREPPKQANLHNGRLRRVDGVHEASGLIRTS